MFIMINLPSCFMKQHPLFQSGGTVCLDQDAMDDATIADDLELQKTLGQDDTQRTGSTVMDFLEEEDMLEDFTECVA